MSKKKKVSKAAQKKALVKMMRDDAKSGLYGKAPRAKVKKVEIVMGWDPERQAHAYAFVRPKAETWVAGYARPFTAKRGAERHFKDFIAKGGRLEFVKNY